MLGRLAVLPAVLARMALTQDFNAARGFDVAQIQHHGATASPAWACLLSLLRIAMPVAGLMV
jgi:hypothetical protein